VWRTTEALLSKGFKSNPLEQLWSALVKFFGLGAL
jgi:hypothetical protein